MAKSSTLQIHPLEKCFKKNRPLLSYVAFNLANTFRTKVNITGSRFKEYRIYKHLENCKQIDLYRIIIENKKVIIQLRWPWEKINRFINNNVILIILNGIEQLCTSNRSLKLHILVEKKNHSITYVHIYSYFMLIKPQWRLVHFNTRKVISLLHMLFERQIVLKTGYRLKVKYECNDAPKNI